MREILAGLLLAFFAFGRGDDNAAPAPKPAGCKLSDLGFGSGLLYAERGGAKWGDKSTVVIAFHGMGGQPAWMLAALEALEGKAKILVPRGPNALGPNRAWWFERASSLDQAKLAAQMTWTISNLAPAIAKVRACNPGARVVLIGHSQGGMLAAALGAKTKADGIVAGSAWVPVSMWEPLPGATLIHGTQDDTIDYARSKQWGENVAAEFVAVEHGHGLSGELLDLWIEATETAL